MRIVIPFGFYGWGNIGDESTLQGFARLIAGHPRIEPHPWVASRNRSHTARIEPSFRYYDALARDLRGWWARQRADAYLFAGGMFIFTISMTFAAPIPSPTSRRSSPWDRTATSASSSSVSERSGFTGPSRDGSWPRPLRPGSSTGASDPSVTRTGSPSAASPVGP